MDKETESNFEVERRTLWRQVLVAYVSAANSTQFSGAVGWADKAVKEFDERFKPKVQLPFEEIK